MIKPIAVIVKGNSKYITGKIARNFYKELYMMLLNEGFSVTFDPGEDYTCPRKADLYIMHSKGADRRRCISDKDMHKVIFTGSGMNGAINHPVDDAWMHNKPEEMSWDAYGLPPDEHYMITPDMQAKFKARIRDIKPKTKSLSPPSSRL